MSSEKKSDILKKNEDFEVKVGDGLWQQLENQHKRELVIHTGPAGLKIFHDSLRDMAILNPLREEARELRDNKSISETECETLIMMINSPDYESFELAQDLINVKMQEHGDTIRSRRAQVYKY